MTRDLDSINRITNHTTRAAELKLAEIATRHPKRRVLDFSATLPSLHSRTSCT